MVGCTPSICNASPHTLLPLAGKGDSTKAFLNGTLEEYDQSSCMSNFEWNPFLAMYLVSTSCGTMAEKYSRTPHIQISWDGEPSTNAENPDN
jgi:hypothetical protein